MQKPLTTVGVHPELRDAIRRAMKQIDQQAKAPKPKNSLRLSPGLTMLVTPALRDQIDRFAAEEKVSRAKVIRRALYEYMRNPKKFDLPPSSPALPRPMLPPERPISISWTMPIKEDREMCERMAKDRKLKLSTMARRAVYTYTRSHLSPNKDEALEATADAWV